MIKGLLNVPWFLWAAPAVLVAVLYSFFWPHKAAAVGSGFRFFIIRWGHAVVWILLALNFILRGISSSLNGTANMVASAGAFLYILFIGMSFVVK